MNQQFVKFKLKHLATWTCGLRDLDLGDTQKAQRTSATHKRKIATFYICELHLHSSTFRIRPGKLLQGDKRETYFYDVILLLIVVHLFWGIGVRRILSPGGPREAQSGEINVLLAQARRWTVLTHSLK